MKQAIVWLLLILCHCIAVARADTDAVAHPQALHQNNDAPRLLEQLNRGFAILREEGAIQSVYQWLGLLNKRVADWQTVQCTDGTVIKPNA